MKLSTGELIQLRIFREERTEDERVRYALGLRLIGYRYGPYGESPLQLFVGSDGRNYVQERLGKYRRLP